MNNTEVEFFEEDFSQEFIDDKIVDDILINFPDDTNLELAPEQNVDTYLDSEGTKSDVVLIDRDEKWRKLARCLAVPKLFFSQRKKELAYPKYLREKNAKEVCDSCPVQRQCREYALANKLLGFWAGENEEERADRYGVMAIGVSKVTIEKFKTGREKAKKREEAELLKKNSS